MELLPVNCFFFSFTLCACAFGLHTMNVDMVPHQRLLWILQISTCSKPPEQRRVVTSSAVFLWATVTTLAPSELYFGMFVTDTDRLNERKAPPRRHRKCGGELAR